jgi:hypothetical protein
MKKKDRKLGAEIAKAVSKSDNLATVNKALADVFGEGMKGAIRNIEIEIDPVELGFGDDGGWSGNIYRYSF